MVNRGLSSSKFVGMSAGYYFFIVFGGIFIIVSLLMAADNDWFFYNNKNISICALFLVFGLSLVGSPSYLKFNGDRFVEIKIKFFIFKVSCSYHLKNYRAIMVNKKIYHEPTTSFIEKDEHEGFAVYLLPAGQFPPLEVSQFTLIFNGKRELDKYIRFAKKISLLTGLPVMINASGTNKKG